MNLKLITDVYIKLFILLLSLANAYAYESQETEKPAANWDFVPNIVVYKPFNLGILAFHSSGIERVDFFADGIFIASTKELRLNPETKVNEYFITINPDTFTQSEITFTAKVYTIEGGVRELNPLVIFSEKKQYNPQHIYVSIYGDDATGNGSKSKPLKTISYALKVSPVGSDIILLDPGTYYLTGVVGKNIADVWTTVKGEETLKREQVILSMPTRDAVRLRMDHLKFENVSIDFAGVKIFYAENGHSIWFNNVVWFDSNFKDNPPEGEAPLNYEMKFDGVRSSKFIKAYYVTNSIVHKNYGGFVGAKIARNVVVDNVLGDALTNSRLVANAEIKNLLGNETEVHSDIFQYYGSNIDNVIVYNVIGSNIGGIGYRAKYKKVLDNGVQNLFIGDSNTTIKNSAFVNVCVENRQSVMIPPFSQLNSFQSNVLYDNITTVNQKWLLRADLSGTKRFIAQNVTIRNSNLPKLITQNPVADVDTSLSVTPPQRFFEGVPNGVVLENNNLNFSPESANGFCASKIVLPK